MGRSKSTIWWLPWVTLEIKPTFGGRARVGGMYGHVRSGRALPDGFELGEKDEASYSGVGNAVSVPVVAAIARAVVEAVAESTT